MREDNSTPMDAKGKTMTVDISALESYADIKDKLFIRLSPVGGSEAIRESSPYRIVDDLLITYHIAIKASDDGFMSARITNKMLADYGLTAEKLHEDALTSTAKAFPPKLQSLTEALTGEPDEDDRINILVVTNQEGIYGASVLFLPDVMAGAAKLLSDSYFAIPSSIHEMLLVKESSCFTAAELAETLKEANESVVAPSDVLSYSIYHYDATSGSFEKADAYEKRISAKAV